MNRTDVGFRHKVRQKVLAAIDDQADELIRFLQEYVSHKSVNPGRGSPDDPGEEATCQQWLAGRLSQFSVFDKVDLWEEAAGRPNLAVVLGGSSGQAGLMFNGHTDTVEVTASQRSEWQGDPWSGEIRGGKLFGRGATDMKAGNAAFLWAAKVLGESKVPLAANVVLTCSIGEETAEAEIGPMSVIRRGYTAPLVVNAEPTNMAVAPATMGWFFFRISVIGKALHPASRFTAIYPSTAPLPLPGVDAIDKMRRIMQALSDLERDWGLYQKHPLMAPGSMNVCPVYIRGGNYRASMSEACEVIYAVPYSPGLRSAQVIQQIKEAVDGVVRTDTWLREHPPSYEIPVIHQILEPVNLPPDHPDVQAVAAAYREALDAQPEVRGMPGPCDANIMNEAGLTTVIFGPGDLSMNAHGTNEYVPVQHVIDACKVYASLMIDRCADN